MATKYKKLRKAGKVYIVSSTDGGKTWSKPKLYNSKEHRQKVEMSKFSPKYHKEMEERRKRDDAKRNNKNKNKNTIKVKNENQKKSSYTPLEDDNDAADRQEESIYRKSTSVKQAKEKHAKIAKDKANKRGEELAKGATTKGGPVKDGVKYARSKGDDLAGFRRGPNRALGKDTRITKHLKKSGFTEDRLARLRKKHAEWKAARKNKKTLKKNTMGG